MKESIKKLQEEKQNLVNRLDDVSTPLEALKRFYSKREIPTCAQETIDLLQFQSDELKHQIKGFTKAIEGFQDVCTHKNEDGESLMCYSGHNSHKTYYECSICGYEDDY
jgi:hypothetical protein